MTSIFFPDTTSKLNHMRIAVPTQSVVWRVLDAGYTPVIHMADSDMGPLELVLRGKVDNESKGKRDV